MHPQNWVSTCFFFLFSPLDSLQCVNSFLEISICHFLLVEDGKLSPYFLFWYQDIFFSFSEYKSELFITFYKCKSLRSISHVNFIFTLLYLQNENVDRPATSRTTGQNARQQRQQRGHRNLKRKTSEWKRKVWREMMRQLFIWNYLIKELEN